jgi:phenylpropionate dioxygenase-like ring-hydroxylating dioxygenase large terminal subunit
MKTDFYFDPKIYEQEYSKIFNRTSFVCEASLLNTNNSYYSYLNFGRPISIRKCEDEFLAVENICLHRSNLIDPIGQGVRDFKCNYHGWKYESDGSLSRAPLADVSCLQRKILNSRKLAQYKDLLFYDDDGEIAEEIELLNEMNYLDCGTFYQSELLHECNWKLLVENVVESYHISFAHPESFVPTGITSTSANFNKYKGGSSYFEIENKKIKDLESDYSNNYKHAFIYPNLFVSLTAGVVGFMSYIIPISPEKTLLKWRLFETKNMSNYNESVKKYIRKNSIDFASRVLNEDLVLLNSSQLGIRHAKNKFQLQKAEERIDHFHRTYLSRMGVIV